ncbi:MAG: hypothetical protein QY312_01180 [Candidatus Dojkabacteria bacterium]|nr:MAG: hypothetical protein QY312_01180 [Candidatus Dojkabacteria bacterium]
MNTLLFVVKSFITSHWGKLVVLLGCVTILLSNVDSTKTIMGLDNASPWFGMTYVYNLIEEAESFVEFGPIVFSPLLHIAYVFTAQASLISQFVYWGNFFLGILGILYLFNRTIKLEHNLLSISGFILIIAHLSTIWMFSQPTFLFTHAFAGIPWLIVLFLGRDRQNQFWLLPTILGLFSFLPTYLNPVAFTTYFICSLLLAYFLKQEMTIKNILRKGLIVGVALLLCIQVTMLLTGKATTVWHDLHTYTQSQLENQENLLASEGLRASEIEHNSFTNVMRFVTGWIELNDLDSQSLFVHTELYQKNIIFIVIQLAPIVFIIWWYYLKRRGTAKQRQLLTTFFITVVLCSSYFLIWIGRIPYLSDAWRWPTSKVWPLLTLPVWYLFLSAMRELPAKVKTRAILIFTLAASLLTFPWFSSLNNYRDRVDYFAASEGIMSPYVSHTVPQEYLQLQTLSKEDTILALDKPQKGFYRYYPWGYYGTDFLSFLTKATIIDGTRTNAVNQDYMQYLQYPNSWKSATITHLLVNKNTEALSQDLEILRQVYDVLLDNQYFTLLKITYD